MARLFVPNFSFEDRLAGRRQYARAIELERTFACRWGAVMEAEDRILSDADYTAPPEEFCPPSWSFPQSISSPQASADFEIVPWGWDETVPCAMGNDQIEIANVANSRVTSMQWELARGIAPAGSCVLEPVDDRMSLAENEPWVMKAEFGMAGRERFRGQGCINEAAKNWLAARFDVGERVVFEPWLAKTSEVSWHFDVHPDGVTYIGRTELESLPQGQHAANVVGEKSEESAPAIPREFAEHLGRLGYEGPLGIDGLQLPNGEFRWIQDGNARWTMGRLAIAWRERLGYPIRWEHSRWTQDSESDRLAALRSMREQLPLGVRLFVTSPWRIDGQLSAFVSLLKVQADA